MGIDYSVYYGPYIEVKTKGLKRPKEYEYQACNNPSCDKYKKAKSDGKFCVSCGKPLEMISETVEETWDAGDMVEEMGINDQVYPEYVEDADGDTQIFYPQHDELNSGGGSVKYDNLWVDLTDLDVKEEIAKVRKYCAKALDILEKMYGSKPVIKWGILSSAG